MNIFKDIRCNYVSFDIFDTLLYRKVDNPNEIHYLTEKKLIIKNPKYKDYHVKRIVAEIKAHKSGKTEATIEDIYSFIEDYTEEEKKEAISIEIQTEIENLYPNLLLKQRLKDLKDRGKKILIISDMYFTSDIISEILANFNIEYDYLFVSSDIQLRKRNGKLFKYVLKELKISNKDILHVGDNKISDVYMPKLCGIKSVLWKKRNDKHLEKFTLNNKEIYQFLKEKKQNNYYEYIGYKYFGPALYGFCQWIHLYIEKEKLDSICFLSRDGQIVSKAYKMIYNQNYPYFLASRRSLTVPLLENAKNMADVLNIVPYIKRNETTQDFLKKIGLDDKELRKKIEDKFGSNLDRKFLLSTDGDALFEIIKEKMYDNSKNEKEYAKEYVEKYIDDGRIGLVDIGWYGTMQKCIESLCEEINLKKSFYGLYFGLLKRNDAYKVENASGFVYSYKDLDSFDENLIYGFNGLIELMFTADHGSAKRYKKSGNEIICELEQANGEYSDFVKNVQLGALRFIEEYKDKKNDFIATDLKKLYCVLEDFLTNPTKEECYLLGDLKFYDAYFESLIQYKGIKQFIINPKKNIKLFFKSNWKIGYLKEMFSLLRPKIMYKIINKLK